MNFDDVYKTMLLKRGGSVKNSDIKNSKDSINRKFKNDPSYRFGKLLKNKLNKGIWAKALVEDILFIHDLKVVANNFYKLIKILFQKFTKT